jgi:CelD/BcsL family acetyltransferase involved in cellulose biosynthesis
MTVRVAADLAAVVALDSASSAIAAARRAAVSDRYAPGSFAVEWRALDSLPPIAAPWRELAARALEPNVFYEPAFLQAAAPVFAPDAGAVLVWSGDRPQRLLGFLPARIERRRYGLKLPVLVGLTHRFGPLGVPLVEREAAEPVIAALFARLAADQNLPGLVLLPFLPQDGPFASALNAFLRRAQMPRADFNRHRRALFEPGQDRAGYVRRAVGKHRMKELRRQARRLSEIGAVMFTGATEPANVADTLDDFLSLEARGWKGHAGTAIADDADLAAFIRSAMAGLAAEGKVTIYRIMLDGRAVAAAIVLRSGHRAWFWKIAYDEVLARYSPGVMISVEVTYELADDADIARADSCATANHPMIDRLWRERLILCDRLIAVRPQAPFAMARQLEGMRAAFLAAARRVRSHLAG